MSRSTQYHSKEGYYEYLKSQHWQNFRRRIYARCRHCQHCGRIHGRLNIHHITYDRLGGERTSDVMVLCEICHKLHHLGAIKRENLKHPVFGQLNTHPKKKKKKKYRW